MRTLIGKFNRLSQKLGHGFHSVTERLARENHLKRASQMVRESQMAGANATAGAGKLGHMGALAGATNITNPGTTAGAGQVANVAATADAGNLANAGTSAGASKLAGAGTTAGASKLTSAGATANASAMAGTGTTAGASKLAGAGTAANASAMAGTSTTAGASKLAGMGLAIKLLKLLLLALPIGIVMLCLWLIGRRIVSIVQRVWRWIAAETALAVIILASVVLLSVAGWMVYDHLQERRIFIAAGSRTSESYKLAQALKIVTARHYPHIKTVILEIDATPGDAGPLEKGILQLAIMPSGLPAGPSARSVAVLASTTPRVLLARNDVDERVVYALTQVLTQFNGELAAAVPTRNATPQPLAIQIQTPVVKEKSDIPLHPGAVAFYDRDKTLFIFRYARFITLVFAGLVLLGIWTWQLKRRARPAPKANPIRFSPPANRAPWTFSKILLESKRETS